MPSIMGWLLSNVGGSPILWRIGSIVVVGAGLFFFGWLKGNQHGTGKLEHYIIAENAAKIKVVAAQEKKAASTERVVSKAVTVVRVKGDTIIKEVPVYVNQKSDSDCVIPTGFVLLHTAALENTTAGTAAESLGTDSGYTLSQVLETDAKAFANLSECRIKLEGVKKFYNEIKHLRE